MCHSQTPESRVQDDAAEGLCYAVSWNSAEVGVLDRAHPEDGVRNWGVVGDRAWLTARSLSLSVVVKVSVLTEYPRAVPTFQSCFMHFQDHFSGTRKMQRSRDYFS